MNGRLKTLSQYALLALFALLAVTACDSRSDIPAENAATRANPSFDWLKQDLLMGVVEPRLKHGLLPSGFYQPNLGPDWNPVPPQIATLISQTRLIYVMAMGYEVSGDARHLDAMKRAADYLLANFPEPSALGRWARTVSSDGKIVSRDFHAYGHAHVIMALSHAFKVSGDSRYLKAAMQTWLALDVPNAIAGKNQLYDLRGLNVSMHMFEALLVLFRATDSKLVRSDLKLLGDYIVAHFFDPKQGYFVEELTATPERARKPDGEVRLGHSIEMAFLLSRAVDAGLPRSYLDQANASVSFVARIAARDGRGIIPHTVDYAGNVRDAEYYWWCQTELLRGLAHFVLHRDRDDLRAQLESSMRSVRDLYVDPVHGGWYKTPGAKGKNKGDDWKVGYHVTMMETEIMRLNGMQFRSGPEVLL